MQRRRTDRAALGPTLPVLAWIVAVLWCDQYVSLLGQLGLGIVTWALLVLLLSRESWVVRAQTVVVVVMATIIEYTFSGWLGVYVYRLDHVPAYVPPGHGLVYLAALGLSRSAVVTRWPRWAIGVTIVVAGAYATWGLFFSPRPDVLGAFWFLCLLGFMIWGRSRLLYVGAFGVVTFLELLGTHWGIWTWQAVDPTGLVSIGNPPSGAAGGYGWFDLVGMMLAPAIVAMWQRVQKRSNTAECKSPLVVTAQPAASAGDPSNPVI